MDGTFFPGHTETMPRGRVPFDPADRRSTVVKVRLTAAEAEALTVAARAAEVTASEFLRRGMHALNDALSRVER